MHLPARIWSYVTSCFREKTGPGWFVLLLVFPQVCCNSQQPAGLMLRFDLANREVKYVNPDLDEISGIFFLNDGQKMAAINDEEGRVFVVDFSGNTPTQSYHFGKKGDYEDIVASGGDYYILQSKGRLHRVPADDPEKDEKIYDLDEKDSDFETLYVDERRNSLIMLCKSCRYSEKKGALPAFAFDLDKHKFDSKPVYMFDTRKVRALVKDKYMDCKPSAAAIHPILGKLFVLCSVGKVLVICDTDGNVEEAFRLDPSFFPQPEGITFAPNGDMYISNEGQSGRGTIIRFPFVAP